MAASEKVYLNRDNVIQRQLLIDNVVINHTLITRVKLEVTNTQGTTVLDSSVNPAYFDYTNANYLVIKLGFSSLAMGYYTAKLITYDSGHTDGLVWGCFQLQIETG